MFEPLLELRLGSASEEAFHGCCAVWPSIEAPPWNVWKDAFLVHNRNTRHGIVIGDPRKSSWTGWSVRLWWCRARRDDAE